MALQLQDLVLYATQAIGSVDSNLPPSGGSATTRANLIVNQAGRYMFKHLWNFRIAPPALLAFIAPITISNGTWTTSTKTITKTSGFTSYTFAAGDYLNLTDGTGATEGFYIIASRTSNDAITLAVDCGATNASADIDCEIDFPYMNLPSDFGQLVGLEMNSTSATICPTDIQTVTTNRVRGLTFAANEYLAAVEFPGQSAVGSAFPVPRMALDHAPTASDPDVCFCRYRRAWTTMSTGTDYVNIPEYAEDLLFAYVQAFVEGFMNAHADEDGIIPVVTLNDRLKDIDMGPLFHMTVGYDGLQQSDYGSIGEGPAGSSVYYDSWRARSASPVADPS